LKSLGGSGEKKGGRTLKKGKVHTLEKRQGVVEQSHDHMQTRTAGGGAQNGDGMGGLGRHPPGLLKKERGGGGKRQPMSRGKPNSPGHHAIRT